VCRGEEGSVKGRDRRAAAQPPLTPLAPRLCCCYPGMSAGIVQWITWFKTNFAFIKSKSELCQLFPKKHSDDYVHLLFPKLRLRFVLHLNAIENQPQWVG
jgi:hypothetical protein